MIKNFEEYINEDYFSKLANRKDNGNVRKENEVTEDLVRSVIEHNFEHCVSSINIRKDGNKTIVDIDGDFYLKTDVEEIPFQFGKVTGDFKCSYCKNLKSLWGCPQEVGGSFVCAYCDSLSSLDGCPREVGCYFLCSSCPNLISLEGCPQKINGDFKCNVCMKLKSLKGGPIEVGGKFDCSCCDSLTSLEGCPQKMQNGIFQCSWCHGLTSLTGLPNILKSLYAVDCGKKFTEEEVKSLCNVKGVIRV